MKTLGCLVLGAGALLGLKYVVFGLDNWNGVLHPGLVLAPNQLAFRKPFLGLLDQCKPKRVYQPADY